MIGSGHVNKASAKDRGLSNNALKINGKLSETFLNHMQKLVIAKNKARLSKVMKDMYDEVNSRIASV